MKIEWWDPAGILEHINSDNPELLAQWFKEMIIKYRPAMMNTSYPNPRISFWPSGEYNVRDWPLQHMYLDINQLMWIYEGFKEMKMVPSDKTREEFKDTSGQKYGGVKW